MEGYREMAALRGQPAGLLPGAAPDGEARFRPDSWSRTSLCEGQGPQAAILASEGGMDGLKGGKHGNISSRGTDNPADILAK
jgi:hypothetical protein